LTASGHALYYSGNEYIQCGYIRNVKRMLCRWKSKMHSRCCR
jgi:hypothetical protein